MDPGHIPEGGDPMEERFLAVGLKRLVPRVSLEAEEDLPNEFLADLSVCSSCPFRGSCSAW